MSDMKKNAPELRFKGFVDDWEQRKLGEVAEFNPKSILPEQFEYVDLESVVGTDLISHRTEKKESAPSRAQRLAKRGDVFYQTVRPYQKNNYLFDLPYENFVFSTGYAQMRPNIDSYFLLSRVQEGKFVSNVLDNTTGTSYPAINANDLSQIKIGIPLSMKEQTKIGKFFKQLDKTIALYQKKLKGLTILKKAYLSHLFDQRIQFSGVSGEWKQSKLGNLANFSKGSGYTKSDLTDDGHPIILYGRLYTNYETIIESVDTFAVKKENSVISKGNEVIVPSSGETSEDISRASVVSIPGVILGGDLNIIEPSDEIDPVFLALTISNGKQQKELSKRAQGKSIVHLHNSDLKEVNLLFPKKEEQIKIGNFFGHLDKTIDLYQTKIDKLNIIKLGFLQKMFI